MKARVAERGQVTIPQALRRKLGIRPGTVLDFEIKGSSLVAIKADQRDAVEEVYGCLGQMNTDQMIGELRGEHE